MYFSQSMQCDVYRYLFGAPGLTSCPSGSESSHSRHVPCSALGAAARGAGVSLVLFDREVERRKFKFV